MTQHRSRHEAAGGLVLVSAALLLANQLVVADEHGSTPSPAARRAYHRVQMGVDVHLTLYEAREEVANVAAERAFARIDALNLVFSDYNSDSEAMRLCAAQTGKAHPVSEDLWIVLTTAQSLSEQSNGAFDVTVGPLTKLWRRARRRRELPDPTQLAAAREVVGYRFITLDPAARSVTLAKPGMQLDFGGIAKGYAAQEALKCLQEAGVPRALVAIAGDLAAGDPPPDQPGWRVEVARDAGERASESDILWLKNACVSTAGDTQQFVEIDGVRYSHIVDPRTGLGLTTPSSVTVIAAAGALADGLDTAACLLGPEKGLALVTQSPDTAASFSILTPEGIVTRTSDRWNHWRMPRTDSSPAP